MVQSSELYKKIGAMRALKILSLTSRDISLLHIDFLFLLKAEHASCFLLAMSSEFPNKLPKYLHFLQSVFEFLLIVYSSVLSWLTIRFLFVSIVGIVCLISVMTLLLVVAQEVSSAYCWSIVKAFCTFGVTLCLSFFFLCTRSHPKQGSGSGHSR